MRTLGIIKEREPLFNGGGAGLNFCKKYLTLYEKIVGFYEFVV
jgi:hypothetical protein